MRSFHSDGSQCESWSASYQKIVYLFPIHHRKTTFYRKEENKEGKLGSIFNQFPVPQENRRYAFRTMASRATRSMSTPPRPRIKYHLIRRYKESGVATSQGCETRKRQAKQISLLSSARQHPSHTLRPQLVAYSLGKPASANHKYLPLSI